MRAWQVALSLWLSSSIACSGLSRVPGEGGASWHRRETPHFVLYTDQRERRARATITYFERMLDAYYQLGWEAHGELPVKVELVVLDDRADFDVFSQRKVGGFTVRQPFFDPLIVAPSALPFEGYRTLNHELTHFIAGESLQFQPPWFAEGLAVYLETAYVDHQQRFAVGSAEIERVQLLRRRPRIRARELMAMTETEITPIFYASAWLVVHYLMSRHSSEFVQLQDRLDEGLPLSAAWAAAFPKLTIDQLDTALDDYLTDQSFSYFTRPLRAFSAPAIASSTLDSADVYALRARLFSGCYLCAAPERQSATDDNVQRALQLDPHHLLASVLHIQRLPARLRLAPAQALVRDHPEAWRSWSILASAQLTQTKRCAPEVMLHLRELGTHAAYALMQSAICEAAVGNSAEALALSERALKLGPTETPLVVARAHVLFGLHACAELQKLLPRLQAAPDVKLDPATLSDWSRCGD